jgi:ABC-type transporter Mla subunit MlaD
MTQRKSWSELRTGLVGLGAIVALGAGVLVFARVGSLRGKTFELYVATREARGVIRGTEVWLDGQRVGLVKEVTFNSPAADRAERVLLRLDVLKSAQPVIRRDSRTKVRTGGSLVGDPVIYIGTGTAHSPPIREGDTLRASPQVDFEGVASEFAVATKEFPAVRRSATAVAAQFQTMREHFSTSRLEEAERAFTSMRANVSRLDARVSRSRGSLARLTGEGEQLGADARAALATVDSIRGLLASDHTSVGRFRRDSTLVGHVASVRDELARIRLAANRIDGAFGLARGDSALQRSVDGAYRAMDVLLTDIRRRPLRYIHF